jgi:transcriptional regulator with XRE-family HTH domain
MVRGYLGKRIRLARTRKKMPQQLLAYKVHTTQQTICDYERGKAEHRPDLFLIKRIAKALDVSPEWLLFGTLSKNK